MAIFRALKCFFLFLLSDCLIAEASTSSSMLNNSGGRRHPCRVPDLRGKALSFSALRMMLAAGLLYIYIYGLYDVEVCSFYPYLLGCFYQERMF